MAFQMDLLTPDDRQRSRLKTLKSNISKTVRDSESHRSQIGIHIWPLWYKMTSDEGVKGQGQTLKTLVEYLENRDREMVSI